MSICQICVEWTSRRFAQASCRRVQLQVRWAKIKALKSEFKLERNKQKNHREAFETPTDPILQSQMYTPEALKTKNLTKFCNHLVAFGLQVPELMDRYAARAEELAAQLTASQFTIILNAFARASHRHDAMLKTFSKRMLPKLHMFLPIDFSQLCNAYAKLREHDEVLFKRLALEMPHKLPHFEGIHLSCVANAYARLAIRDDLLFDDIADEVIRRPQDLSHVALLNIANGFSRFKIRHKRLWPIIGEWLLQSHLDLQAQDVATAFNAFSAVDFKQTELFRTLLVSLSQEPLLSQASPTTLCLTFNSLARLTWPAKSDVEANAALDVLVEKVTSQLPALEPVGLTQLLHACSRLRQLQSKNALVEGILEQAGQQISKFPAQSLSLLVNACARLQKKDVPLLTKVAKCAAPLLPEFTPQALAITADSFAKLEVRSEILFYLLAEEILQKIPLFSGQGIGLVLQAYGKLGINNQKLAQACRKHVRALSDELTLWEVDAIEEGFKKMGASDGSTVALLQKVRQRLVVNTAEVDGAWVEDDLLERLAKEEELRMTKHRPEQDVEPKSIAPLQEPAPLDLWDMWSNADKADDKSQGQDSFADSDDGTATSSSRLREYLARPEKVGRKPIVLDSEIPGGGGRKHRRRART
ncbi:unnamed protein product [Durusdinium trenchii]|uniref:RNA-editing substrate-binding complex 6 protein domain-containing protein n=1 Tax=Durusdinium trenchii TaxID=1381693 RepID=A0ABP0RBZ5_9DINO